MELSKDRKKELRRLYKNEQKYLLREKLCITKTQLYSLVNFLEMNLEKTQCDHKFSYTFKWASKNQIDFSRLKNH